MNTDWTTAPCARIDPELWHPAGRGASWATRKALSYCATCPLKQECLDLAMAQESGLAERFRFGIFGGTTPRERAAADPLIITGESAA